MQTIRDQIINFLREENAHANIDTALKNLPLDLVGIKHPDLPYSIWQLTEHIRITQWDIVEFSLKQGKHISPAWPTDFWPRANAPANSDKWKETIHSIKNDRDKMIKLISDPENDLFKPFPHGQGQNIFREALLIIDHTSYHIGEIIVLRRLFNSWD